MGHPLKVLVLGVGNILLCDEGVGVKAAESLMNGYDLPDEVTVADGGTGGPRLTSLMKGFGLVIILDAVKYGGEPGTLYRIPGDELKKSPPIMATAHEITIPDLLALAALEGIEPEVVIIGIEPKEITPSLELTDTVKDKLPRLVELTVEELEKRGFTVNKRRAHA